MFQIFQRDNLRIEIKKLYIMAGNWMVIIPSVGYNLIDSALIIFKGIDKFPPNLRHIQYRVSSTNCII